MRILAVTLLALVACEDDRPPPSRALRGVNQGAALDRTPTEVRRGDRFREPAPDRRPGVSPQDLQALEITTRRTRETPAAPEHDYARELSSAAGSPMSCGALGTQPGELRIPLSATISVQGVVIRASVGGPIPSETRDCLRQRIETHRFRPPGESPESISATLVLQGTAAPTMEEEATPMTGFALQTGQTAIHGPSGVEISNERGAGITMNTYSTVMATGTTIMGPSGTMIAGPSGQGIQNYR